jgi:predicted RNase H-like HicB family nuclease
MSSATSTSPPTATARLVVDTDVASFCVGRGSLAAPGRMRDHADEGAGGNPVARKARLDGDAIEGEPSELQAPRSALRRHCSGQRWEGTCARYAERYTQEGRLEMSPKRYPLVIERTGTGYSAYSPDVPGCAAAGDTEEETRRNFQDALASHFEAMREVGEPIPEPSSSVDYVEVAA